MYYSTKNYPTSLGMSTCFRQWKADSHCSYLHGYALGFRFKFRASYLDQNGWVVDFGSLKALKERLMARYDHRLLITHDDPEFSLLMQLSTDQVARVIAVDKVGCEAFATHGFHEASELINDERVRVISCECYEHEANSAIYEELG